MKLAHLRRRWTLKARQDQTVLLVRIERFQIQFVCLFVRISVKVLRIESRGRRMIKALLLFAFIPIVYQLLFAVYLILQVNKFLEAALMVAQSFMLTIFILFQFGNAEVFIHILDLGIAQWLIHQLNHWLVKVFKILSVF